MTASERIRAARDRRRFQKLVDKYEPKQYPPAECGCLRCRILRFTED
jgi:hypothetical protein